MVTVMTKWLTFSCVVFLGFGMTPHRGLVKETVKAPHPFHVSTTEINHNSTDKTLEITCKIFIDDFESCLSKQYRTKADLSAVSLKTAMDTLVKKYISSHLYIKVDNRALALNYLGFEKDEDAVNTYLEVPNIASVKKVDVSDAILHDMFDDQISIIHVIVGGNRKSTRLDYPNKDASFTF